MVQGFVDVVSVMLGNAGIRQLYHSFIVCDNLVTQVFRVIVSVFFDTQFSTLYGACLDSQRLIASKSY